MNVKDIFVEIGMGQMELYEQDFEAQMLQDSGAYYSRKASNWIVDNSCPDYMLKASLCTLFLYYCVVYVNNLCDSNIHYLIHLYRLRSAWKGRGRGFLSICIKAVSRSWWRLVNVYVYYMIYILDPWIASFIVCDVWSGDILFTNTPASRKR